MMVSRIRLVAAVAFTLSFVSGVQAQEFIKGRVNQNAGPVRVARPSAPPMQTGQATQALASKSSAKKSIQIDLGDFRLSPGTGKPELPEWPTETARKLRGLNNFNHASNKIDDSREMTIAWEQWHKRVSEAIYSRWTYLSHTPGEAQVHILVKRDGTVDWSVNSYNGPSFNYRPGQESHFRASVDATLSSVIGDPCFEFPEKSQRQEVELNTKFSAQMDNGPSGYSWKKGDYEKVSGI